MKVKSNHRKFFLLIAQCLLLLKESYTFHIRYCGSNKIDVVSVDAKTNKAVIKYNDKSVVDFPYDGPPIELWCETDEPIRKCELTHLNNENIEVSKCDVSKRSINITDKSVSCVTDNRIGFIGSLVLLVKAFCN